MKVVRLSIISSIIAFFYVISCSAQQGTTEKKFYEYIEVESFTIKQGVEFPADKIEGLTQSVIESLSETNKFKNVSLTSSTPLNSNETRPELSRLKISGEIIKYEKGSQAKRYIIGMGTGKTKLIANVKFINTQTGEVVLEEVVDGIVSWGLFGGDKDQVQSNLAKQIVKIVREKFTDGKKAEKSKKDGSKDIGKIKEN